MLEQARKLEFRALFKPTNLRGKDASSIENPREPITIDSDSRPRRTCAAAIFLCGLRTVHRTTIRQKIATEHHNPIPLVGVESRPRVRRFWHFVSALGKREKYAHKIAQKGAWFVIHAL